MSDNLTTISNTCVNCRSQVVEHLKASDVKCTECFNNETPANRFPNWEKVEDK